MWPSSLTILLVGLLLATTLAASISSDDDAEDLHHIGMSALTSRTHDDQDMVEEGRGRGSCI